MINLFVQIKFHNLIQVSKRSSLYIFILLREQNLNLIYKNLNFIGKFLDQNYLESIKIFLQGMI